MSSAVIYPLFGDRKARPDAVIKIYDEMVNLQAMVNRPLEAYVYAYGTENKAYAEKVGFPSDKVILVDPKPECYPLPIIYKHKAAIWQRALRDFDEILSLDWDVEYLNLNRPVDFWPNFHTKHEFQAQLGVYHKRQTPWRKEQARTIPWAPVVYLRSKKIADAFMKAFDAHSGVVREELAMAWWVDKTYKGTPTPEAYRIIHEPENCWLWTSVYLEKKVVRGEAWFACERPFAHRYRKRHEHN